MAPLYVSDVMGALTWNRFLVRMMAKNKCEDSVILFIMGSGTKPKIPLVLDLWPLPTAEGSLWQTLWLGMMPWSTCSLHHWWPTLQSKLVDHKYFWDGWNIALIWHFSHRDSTESPLQSDKGPNLPSCSKKNINLSCSYADHGTHCLPTDTHFHVKGTTFGSGTALDNADL